MVNRKDKYKFITIHCADTPEGVFYNTKDIRAWHKERNFSDVGYHYIILLDGTLEFGRSLEKLGAHVGGNNTANIGICYIGGKTSDMRYAKDTRTNAQKITLSYLLHTLKFAYPDAIIQGHRDFPNVKKDCPGFDAKKEYDKI